MSAAPLDPGPDGAVDVLPSAATDRLARPLRDLRISVTDRCNLRCTYCLPPDAARPVYLERSRLLTFEQITRVVRACAELGVHKVRLTGGEPLLRRRMPDLIAAIAGVSGIDDVALTTNGSLLAAQATALADAGLRRITVSLDSLDDQVFGRMNGVGAPVAAVLAGIRAARAAGLNPVKLNAVIRRGVNEADVIPLARFARDEGLNLRLIEYMDVGQSNAWRRDDVVPIDELLATVSAVFPLAPAESTPGIVATRHRYLDGAGELGLISAVSQPFCHECTRVRLTADGQLYTCLFGQQGHNLRPLLDGASDHGDHVGLREEIRSIWARRTDRYSAERSEAGPTRGSVEMYRIGG